jgi:hypothetical protein
VTITDTDAIEIRSALARAIGFAEAHAGDETAVALTLADNIVRTAHDR